MTLADTPWGRLKGLLGRARLHSNEGVWIVPSHGLVIVRIGKYRGEAAGDVALRKAMTTLMKAVKESGS